MKADHLHHYQGALEDYNKALEINPTYTEALNNRGVNKRNSIYEKKRKY